MSQINPTGGVTKPELRYGWAILWQLLHTSQRQRTSALRPWRRDYVCICMISMSPVHLFKRADFSSSSIFANTCYCYYNQTTAS
jgi:hypothetical protein